MIDEQVKKIQKFVDSVQHRLDNAIVEKNYLIEQVNSVQDQIAELRKELKEWQSTLDKVQRIGMDR